MTSSTLPIFVLGFVLGLMVRQGILSALAEPVVRWLGHDGWLRSRSIAVGLLPPPWSRPSDGADGEPRSGRAG